MGQIGAQRLHALGDGPGFGHILPPEVQMPPQRAAGQDSLNRNTVVKPLEEGSLVPSADHKPGKDVVALVVLRVAHMGGGGQIPAEEPLVPGEVLHVHPHRVVVKHPVDNPLPGADLDHAVHLFRRKGLAQVSRPW